MRRSPTTRLGWAHSGHTPRSRRYPDYPEVPVPLSAPAPIRTGDLQVRSLTLYPAELRAQGTKPGTYQPLDVPRNPERAGIGSEPAWRRTRIRRHAARRRSRSLDTACEDRLRPPASHRHVAALCRRSRQVARRRLERRAGRRRAVLGPNGFLRHVAGTVGASEAARLAIDVAYTRALELTLSNDGTEDCAVSLEPNAYRRPGSDTVVVGAGTERRVRGPLRLGWYDVTVTCEPTPRTSGHSRVTWRRQGLGDGSRDTTRLSRVRPKWATIDAARLATMRRTTPPPRQSTASLARECHDRHWSCVCSLGPS